MIAFAAGSAGCVHGYRLGKANQHLTHLPRLRRLMQALNGLESPGAASIRGRRLGDIGGPQGILGLRAHNGMLEVLAGGRATTGVDLANLCGNARYPLSKNRMQVSVVLEVEDAAADARNVSTEE